MQYLRGRPNIAIWLKKHLFRTDRLPEGLSEVRVLALRAVRPMHGVTFGGCRTKALQKCGLKVPICPFKM